MRVDWIVIGSHEWESGEHVYIKILDNESVNCEGSLMADQRDNGVLATMDNRVFPRACIAIWQQQLLECTLSSLGYHNF